MLRVKLVRWVELFLTLSDFGGRTSFHADLLLGLGLDPGTVPTHQISVVLLLICHKLGVGLKKLLRLSYFALSKN